MSPHSVRDDDSTARTNQTRRRFLLGAGALTAALAGCTGDDGDSNDDPTDDTTDTPDDDSADDGSDDGSDDQADAFDPASELAYAKWLTTDEEQVLFAYSNVDEIPESTAQGAPSDPSTDDPLVLYPLVVSGLVIGLGQLSLPYAGLARAINPDASADSTVSDLTVINNTVIAEGTFATDQLDKRLTEPADETFGVAHEQTGTIGAYDRYEPVEVPERVQTAPAVAVTDKTVIVSQQADRLEQTIAAGNGNESRIFESDETVAELLKRAGTGDRVVGQLGVPYEQLAGGQNQTIEPDPQFEPRSDEDVVASISFEQGGDSLDSAFALAAAGLEEDRQATIESSLGTAAVDGSRSVSVTEDRVTASGTYDTEQLAASQREQDLSGEAAAELVSPETLTVQYEPLPDQQFDELFVTVTENTNAAGIRVEADSGGYSELRPQERSVRAGDSVAVQVDPDGDSVTVFAVNGEGAAGALTTVSAPTDELSETAASQAVPDGALSFSYESPDAGNLGSLTIEVVADTEAKTLVAQPQEANIFTDRVGSLTSEEPVGAGTVLETAVEPDGDEVIVYASVDGATGEVARWNGPE